MATTISRRSILKAFAGMAALVAAPPALAAAEVAPPELLAPAAPLSGAGGARLGYLIPISREVLEDSAPTGAFLQWQLSASMAAAAQDKLEREIYSREAVSARKFILQQGWGLGASTPWPKLP